MNDIAVNIQHLIKCFGSETVLKDVSLTLEQGKIHGMVGHNGSGKTVLMKCICGFLRPTRGQVQQLIQLASHFAQDIDKVCDTVCEMDQGTLRV